MSTMDKIMIAVCIILAIVCFACVVCDIVTENCLSVMLGSIALVLTVTALLALVKGE